VELAPLDVQRNRPEVLQVLPADGAQQEEEPRLSIQHAVREQQADLVARAVGQRVADDGKSLVNVVPAHVCEHVRVSVGAVPDILLDVALPEGEGRRIGNRVGGAARKREHEQANEGKQRECRSNAAQAGAERRGECLMLRKACPRSPPPVLRGRVREGV
jgi:hypothetical protein